MFTIVTDFEKIKRWLDISNEWRLEIHPEHSEGYCNRSKSIIILGIKDGYNRRLLVHECLHATGMEHYHPPEFESIIKFDEFSKQVEAQVFG